jgi:deoxyadenosine/deoxycytidine kinase
MPPTTPPDALDYVAIEGAIGAGTTTLTELLADRFEADPVLERFEDNPFLERFYEDRERWAFQTQLAFLASRFRQQKELSERDLFRDFAVSDYTFDKDRIFASPDGADRPVARPRGVPAFLPRAASAKH